jgi:hypothetical protein
MSAKVDVEHIQTTKGEKLLAVVLLIFFLIGGIWIYVKIEDFVGDALPLPAPSPQLRAAEADASRAEAASSQAHQAAQQALQNLQLRREAYRTALEAHRPSATLSRQYDRAQAALTAAQAAVRRTDAAAATAERKVTPLQARLSRRVDDREQARGLVTFLVRLAFVLATVGFGYWLLSRFRRTGSRYFAIAIAFVAYAAIMAFVLGTDYVTDYVNPLDLGPFILSVVGILLTLLAFVGLQRYLARRLPGRRVRKGECPFCGFPVRGNKHCEGCGRDVEAPCTNCEAPRRVGTAYCGVCGASSAR